LCLRFVLASLICLLLAVDIGLTRAASSGNISGVLVSPDSRHITIKSDGPLGRHTDFVIGNPNRLVIDFGESGLLKAPRRIRVSTDLVKEIRLGYFGSGARLVIDFGAHAVPPYRILDESTHVVVVLDGKGPSEVPGSPKGRTPRVLAKRSPTPAAPAAHETAVTKKKPSIAIKSANVTDDLVVLELADGKDSKRSCRLVLEVDVERLQVRRATVSDLKGVLKRCDVSEEKAAAVAWEGPSGTGRGPRKGSSAGEGTEGSAKPYKWGLPAVKAREPGNGSDQPTGPVRLEGVTLQRRSSAGES